jgi:hypothetical protein
LEAEGYAQPTIAHGRLREMSSEVVSYDAAAIEAARQEAWFEDRAFDTPKPSRASARCT